MNDQTQTTEQAPAQTAVANPSHIELAKAQWQNASPNTQRGIIAGAALGVGVVLGSIFA
jgi:hypothetical protein